MGQALRFDSEAVRFFGADVRRDDALLERTHAFQSSTDLAWAAGMTRSTKGTSISSNVAAMCSSHS